MCLETTTDVDHHYSLMYCPPSPFNPSRLPFDSQMAAMAAEICLPSRSLNIMGKWIKIVTVLPGFHELGKSEGAWPFV